MAALYERLQRAAHCLEFLKLFCDPRQVIARHFLHIRARAAPVFVKRHKCAAILDRETERPGTTEKREFVDVTFAEIAIAVRATPWPDEVNVLVVPDRFDR